MKFCFQQANFYSPFRYMTYKLEKRTWTDADYDKMGWHDNRIYKLAVNEDLEMDIDYIVKWNQPDIEGLPFTFWVAPATLVFKNISHLKLDLSMELYNSFEIEGIEREEENNWSVILRQGVIQFTSPGFVQYIRQDPSFQFEQSISYIERYGYSLDRTTTQENPNLLLDNIIENRKKEAAHYENVKKRQLKRLELEALVKLRELNEIDTKQYLLKKKEINDLLFSYDYFLKGTRFESW